MQGGAVSTDAEMHAGIAGEGYAFVHGSAMRDMLARSGDLGDWPAFAASWDDLALDRYMADGGRYRRRRHAVFVASAHGPMARQAHQPHFQTIDYNPLQGGVARWFEPMADDVGRSASLNTVMGFCRSTFGSFAPAVRDWRIEVHQFRIEARAGEEGRPTPEGLHRDGVDYVLVLLVARRNIASGVTRIHGLDGAVLGQFTLTHPFDAAMVDDRRVAHGVTPVEPIVADSAAYRDVLVVTFSAQ